MSPFDFTGKKALVTGASRGYGRSLAAALLAGGATVYGVGRSQEKLDELVKDHPGIIPIAADVNDIEGLKKLLEPLHPFDILINNAGTAEGGTFDEATPEMFDKVLSTNLKAPVFVTQMVARGMSDHGRKDCAILNISSIGTQKPGRFNNGYVLSKAALDNLTVCLAKELGPRGIRVNGIRPGLIIETDMGQEVLKRYPKLLETIADLKLPLGTWPTLDEYTDSGLFLLSHQARKITGVTLNVTSGLEIS